MPGSPRGDLRRRHADRAAAPDPRLGEPRAHEPGHAPHRRPAAPRPVGRLPAQPPLRGGRRGARLPRRLRLARRERPAAAAPAGADLRRRAAVPARLGDDREPRRARARAHGRGGDGASRTTRRRAPSGRSRSGTRRCSTPSSGCGRARSARRRGCSRGSSGRGLRTICFAKSRKSAELIHRFASDRLDAATAARLAPYRAGYTPQQRREIERRLVEGELLGVTSTDALELGIDIGDLDCAISVGFPGTVASLRQQWGRAGRREHGLAILIASEDALDQYFMREPPALLERRVEAAILDHANPRVLDGHVAAAAFEAPVDEGRRRDPRPGGARAGAARAGAAPHRARLGLGRQGLAGRPHPAPLHLARLVPRRRRLERRRARAGRAGARVLDRARGRRLPPPRPPVPRPRARPRRRGARSSSRSTATGTRRRRRRRRRRSRRRCASSGGSASSSPSAASR